ncbi:MAG TPA: magnesium/cobalt transporter CorA [Candidatus Polarisedimenticolia bacterium]|nr:magnesium/cobalt transporter CorA [Candidatus Polarisedimenticolia bacterium]
MAAKKRKPPIGARPGTLMVDTALPRPRIHLIRYSGESIHEEEVKEIASLRPILASAEFAWIDVQGLGHAQTIEGLGEIFSIHPLALEDIVHASARPKAEIYPENLLIAVRMLQLDGGGEITIRQMSLVVGRNYVLTFQETYGDVLEPVRVRLRGGGKKLRSTGPGYLAYAIIDTIVDAYLPIIEHFTVELDTLEEQVLEQPEPAALRSLNRIRKELGRIRRSVSPQREAIGSLIRDPNDFVDETSRLYLRDTYDHCLMTSEAVETSRELVNGLMNTYMSAVSNRMNEVMKTLTLVTSLFVPLTFMAGIYGMNFEVMPELHWRWSYPVLLLLMLIAAAGMLVHFRRRGWIGREAAGRREEPDRRGEGSRSEDRGGRLLE